MIEAAGAASIAMGFARAASYVDGEAAGASGTWAGLFAVPSRSAAQPFIFDLPAQLPPRPD